MITYTFHHKGMNFSTKAESASLAMAEANEYFLPYGGAWFKCAINLYEWKSGNFFD